MIIRQFNSQDQDFLETLMALQQLPYHHDHTIPEAVRGMLQDIHQHGDEALLRLTHQFDHHQVPVASALEISPIECKAALNHLDSALRESMILAKNRIEAYHCRQLEALSMDIQVPEKDDHHHSSYLHYRLRPLERVALYVPGGKAAYPSSVLMNTIPAKVAGVQETMMFTPTPKGQRNPVVLAAAALVGVDRVFALGGVQAIAAAAYGTETVPRCDKVVGPGNAWVAEAKRQVFGSIGIDMIAGPSEVLIVSDGSGDPRWIAADLLAQAEHDECAQSILLCTHDDFIAQVALHIREFLPQLPRRAIIEKALIQRSALIRVSSLQEALQISNRFAPEHLMLAVNDPNAWLDHVRHAGSVFCGHYSCEVMGDYCAGTNHVLPTFGNARFSSPLSVYDFLKGMSISHLSQKVVQNIAPHAERMANSESLQAHALSARLRMS